MATTRTAKQWSVVLAKKRCGPAPTIKLTKKKTNLYWVQETSAFSARQQTSSDHQDAMLAKQCQVAVQKSLEKAEISVTLQHFTPSLERPFCLTCAWSIWFHINALIHVEVLRFWSLSVWPVYDLSDFTLMLLFMLKYLHTNVTHRLKDHPFGHFWRLWKYPFCLK